MLIAFPVYRTYGTSRGLPADDAALLHNIIGKITTSSLAVPADILEFLARILCAQTPESVSGQADQFRTRFQQLTGPLMAKSVEDTLFFRQHMDLALNEVGAEPLLRRFSLDRFHQEMARRLGEQPAALSTTSTHDTKRGEDARARLFTLTEAPELWAENVTRWHQMNQSKVITLPDGPAPKLTGAWMLYQALAGAWPATLRPADEDGLRELNERFQLFVEKALREAKLRTNWGDSNDDYENAVLGYARHLLSPDNSLFLNDFYATIRPFIRAGLVNSLTQTVIKMIAPGVPDIYQGSEVLNFSLVDPDNRRLPDFDELEQLLVNNEKPAWDDETAWTSGQLKQHVVAVLARYRQQKTALFLQGDYLPLETTGDHAGNVIAFARQANGEAVIVAAPRLVFNEQKVGFTQPAEGVDTQVLLPESLAHRTCRDLLSGREINVTGRLDLSTWPPDQPVVLCSVSAN